MCQRSDVRPGPSIGGRRGGSASEKAYRCFRVWLPGIMGRGAAATWFAVATVAIAAGVLRAQPADNPLGDLLKPGSQAGEARAPTAEESMAAYLAVEGWVRAWGDPAPTACPAAGVRVGLYLRGGLVGWGASRGAEAVERGALATAAGEAMAMASRTQVPRADALAGEQLRALGSDLVVSVELAGPPTPLGEKELANPDSVVRPGLDGLAARLREEWVVAYPSELLAGGAAAGVRLPAMAARLLGDPALGIALPVDLAAKHGVTFYRFETVRVAGVGPGGSAAFVHRGGSVVETREVTTASLVRFGEAMLGHVEAGMLEGEGKLGLMGPLDAATGIAQPAVATPMQQSLVALGLVRLAETGRLPEVSRARARGLARRIMEDLSVVEPGEVAVEDDGVAAAVSWVVLAQLGAPGDGALGGLYDRCEEMLARHAGAERGPVRSGVSSAVLAWALAERAVRTGRDRAVAERDLRALYGATKPGEVVGLMPWAGWAELALAGDGPVPAASALRRVREEVWDHQLSGLDTGLEERDMAGGIVFTRGFVSLPTWSSSRPVALCATMLGDARLTSESEAPGEIVRLIGAFRFLRQLSARDVECAFYPRADLARGGVREAVWDPRMPPEATAMAMLSVSEFLRSLGVLEGRVDRAETPDGR